MLEFLIKMTLVLALGLAVSLCLPRTRPDLRHTALLSALFALPLLPLTLLIPRSLVISVPSPPQRSVSARDTSASMVHSPSSEIGSSVPEAHSSASTLPMLAALSLIITLCLLLRRLGDALALRRLLGTATPASIPAPFPVLLTTKPTVPLACGVFRRVILLPESAQTWEPERLTAVLLHESAHLTRRDPLWQLLADCLCALFWFHPLVWLTAFRLRLEAENACDRHVLASGIAPDRYATYLLEIVKMLKNRPAAPAMAHSSRLEDRLRSILAYLPPRPTRGVGAALALIGLVTVPLLAARPAPQGEKPVEKVKPVVASKSATVTSKSAIVAVKPATVAKTAKPLVKGVKLVAVNHMPEKRRQEELEVLRLQRERQSAKEKATVAEKRMHDQELESVREELDELKLKLRDLDSRLTDKKLELASLDMEKIKSEFNSGVSSAVGMDRVRGLEKQIQLLEVMSEQVKVMRMKKRDELIARSRR
jgi:Zn-dependent protease with chaperone function